MASESMIFANASILFPQPPRSSTPKESPTTFEIVYASSLVSQGWSHRPKYSALLVRRYAEGSSDVLLRGKEADWADRRGTNGWDYILHGLFEVTALEIEKNFRPPVVPATATVDGYVDVSTEKAEQDKDASQGPPPYDKQTTADQNPQHPFPCTLLEPARFFLPRQFQSIETLFEALAERKQNRTINGPHVVIAPPDPLEGMMKFFPGREELVEELAARIIGVED